MTLESSIQREAARAIALCRNGAIEEGVALYKSVLKLDPEFLPVGVHLKLLQSLGLDETANVIGRLALMAGEDLSLNAAMRRSATDTLEEYRTLFINGLINARMVYRFLVQLSKVGANDELRSVLDPEQRFLLTKVTVGEPALHWKSLETLILGAEAENNWLEEVQSVRKMHKVDLDRRHPRVQATLVEIEEQVKTYIAKWAKNDHVIFQWVPRKFEISSWAVISHGDGYNVPHFHQKAWITGILYIASPDRIDAADSRPGALRIGPPPEIVDVEGWPDITVPPLPGTLVLMPSYYYHWTVPLGRPGLRIAIVFDVIDLRE